MLKLMRRRWNGLNWRAAQPPPSAEALERRAWRVFWLLSALFGLLIWVILVARAPGDPNLHPGRPSPVTIQARRDVRYFSAIKTEEARTKAESDPATVVYRRDTAIPTQQRNQLTDLLLTISQIRGDPTLSSSDQRTRLAQLPNSTLVITDTMASQIVALAEDEWAATRQLSTDLYDRALREKNFELSDQDVTNIRERSLPYWAAERGSGPSQALAVAFASPFLRANLVVDEQATRKRKQDARDAVTSVEVQVLQGESLIREGDLVTPDVLEKLEALGELQSDISLLRGVGRGALALLAAALLSLFIANTRKSLWLQPRRTLVIYTLVLVTLVLGRLLLVLPLNATWTYAFPIGATVLLLAALFDSGVALLTATILSFLIGFMGGNAYGLQVALLLSSIAGVFVLGRANRSLRFVLAGCVIILVVALVQVALWLVASSLFAAEQLGVMLLASALSGVMAVIFALGLYNLVGILAGVVTPFQLMELANPAQPLLRKLIREAPGTYYHSVAVGNLAESAAEAIGADALLLRVAAYYHDVGKAARPYFYTDNQSDRENVHNDLDPRTSAQIIADHVREGVNMGRAAHLPQQIIDFIPTHHGTSVIQHFYQLAMREQDSVDVADFRYPGPKPQTREQAILMLADSTEATVRAKSQHGKLTTARQQANGASSNGAQTLEELVTTILDERIRSGQLDESALTLADLAAIRRAFLTTLQGIYHPRVEYAPQLIKT